MDASWKVHGPEDGHQVSAIRTSPNPRETEVVLVLDPTVLEVTVYDPLLCGHPAHVVACEHLPVSVLVRLLEAWGFTVTPPKK